MSRQFTVAIDLDSTVYDLHKPWLEWIEREKGKKHELHEIDSWEWNAPWIKEFIDLHDVFLTMPLLPGVQRAIQYVHEMGVRQCFVSTCKTQRGAYEKMKAVQRDFPYLKDDVIITSHNKDLIRADMLVDDGPHNLLAFPGITCKVPYKYNEHVDTDYTLFEWEDYKDIVIGILRDRGQLEVIDDGTILDFRVASDDGSSGSAEGQLAGCTTCR